MDKKTEIKDINQLKDFLKKRKPMGLENQNRQERPFDNCDLYLLFDCVIRELESLKK